MMEVLRKIKLRSNFDYTVCSGVQSFSVRSREQRSKQDLECDVRMTIVMGMTWNLAREMTEAGSMSVFGAAFST